MWEFTEHAEPADRHARRSTRGFDDLDLAVVRHHRAAPRTGSPGRAGLVGHDDRLFEPGPVGTHHEAIDDDAVDQHREYRHASE